MMYSVLDDIQACIRHFLTVNHYGHRICMYVSYTRSHHFMLFFFSNLLLRSPELSSHFFRAQIPSLYFCRCFCNIIYLSFSLKRLSLVSILSGIVDGEEWVWEDQYEIHHLCQLHCQRYKKTGSHK